MPMLFHAGIGEMLKDTTPNLCVHTIKTNYVLLSTIYEVESKPIHALRARLQIPVYTSGPNISYSQIEPELSLDRPVYLNWLDSKQPRSVLYVSLGSFLSVSLAEMVEMAEMAYDLTQSGVNFLWVARGEISHVRDICGDKGLVLEWCDQLRVLLHSSIGGFLTHCGWNSVKEGLFSGVPMLTFPITIDQPLNSKMIVKDWKIGVNMREKVGVFKREEIAKIASEFMNSEGVARLEMMKRVENLQRICQESVEEAGSVNENLDAFIRDITTNLND
ncbi:hypothetical protein R6Q59_005083 [Mikania micrantha]